MLHKGFGKDLPYVLFGIIFQMLALSVAGGVLALVAAAAGGLAAQWVVRFGLILELGGLIVLFLEYLGVAQSGRSPLRWWLRNLRSGAHPEPGESVWPRQAVIVLGVTALVLGLVLQLLGSFAG